MFRRIVQHTYIKIFRYPNFRKIWLANLISNAGNILYDVALLWLVAEETRSALAVGSVVISGAISYLIFGLLGGAVADRFERRKVMVVVDVLRAGVVILIPILTSVMDKNSELGVTNKM